MRGIVLAAGLGTRMRPLTNHVPKALLPVCGRTMLERALAFLAIHGIGPLAVNTHHHHEQVDRFCRRSGIACVLSHEEGRVRGTGGALWYARDFLCRDDFFAVCNIEPVVAFQLAPLLWQFVDSCVDAALVSVPVESGGTVFYESSTGDFLGTRDDTVDQGVAAQACFVGVALYRRRFLELVGEDDFGIQPIWHRARDAGMRVVVMVAPRGMYWRDVGTPAQLAAVHFDVLAGVSPLRPNQHTVVDTVRRSAWPAGLSPEDTARIGSLVWCGADRVPPGTSLERCVVLPGTKLEPDRCYENLLVTPWGDVPIG